MGQTQPMGTPGSPTRSIPKAPNIQSTAEEVEEEWEEEYEESGLMPFAIIVLILSLVVLGIELYTKMGAGSCSRLSRVRCFSIFPDVSFGRLSRGCEFPLAPDWNTGERIGHR